MKIRVSLIAAAFAVASLLGPSAMSAEVTIKALSFLPKRFAVMAGARNWSDDVNKVFKGELQINYLGGSEIIGRFDQPEAVRSGTLDMGFFAGADLQDTAPEAQALVLSKLDPTGERKSGFYDHLDAIFQRQLNSKYIGRLHSAPFYFWLNQKPTSLADLKGKKLRTGSLYDRLMRHYGAIPVTMNAPEVFTALERGVVDGLGWTNVGPRILGWTKKTKYALDIPFFPASNLIVLMNLDKWNAFGPDLQKRVMNHMVAFEPKVVEHFRKEHDQEWIELEKIGVERVKVSAAETSEFLRVAYALEWAALKKRVGQDGTDKLRRLTGN